MTTDLASFIASLPSQQEQRRRKDIEMRREKTVQELALDPILFPPDPRKLSTMAQCVYIVRLTKRGISKDQIIDLFYGDESGVNMLIEMIGVNNLLK